MPRNAIYKKEEIIDVALQIVREQGYEALSARSLSKALNCSITPIFTMFENMEEVVECTFKAAGRVFANYFESVTDYVPAFKEFGMRMVSFARQESNLFNFLCQEGDKTIIPHQAVECMQHVCTDFAIDNEKREAFNRQIWTFICGLVAVSSADREKYTDEVVSEMWSTQFLSTLFYFKSGRAVDNPTPRLRKKGEKITLEVEGL